MMHLWAPCDVLLDRFLKRNPRYLSRMMWLRALCHHGFQMKNLDSDFRPLYQNPSEVIGVYREWTRFCDSDETRQHWLVDASDERYRFTSLKNLPDDLVDCVGRWTDGERVATTAGFRGGT